MAGTGTTKDTVEFSNITAAYVLMLRLKPSTMSWRRTPHPSSVQIVMDMKSCRVCTASIITSDLRVRMAI